MSDDKHHGPSYLQIFLALVVLTVITIVVGMQPMNDTLGLIIALIIATIKASLVALYFMHLKTEIKPVYVIVGAPVLLFLILVIFLLPDVAFPGYH